MTVQKPIYDWIKVIRTIPESDNIKWLQDRVRGTATRIASSELAPRIVATSASILAALLTSDDTEAPAPHHPGPPPPASKPQQPQTSSASLESTPQPISEVSDSLRELAELPDGQGDGEHDKSAEPAAGSLSRGSVDRFADEPTLIAAVHLPVDSQPGGAHRGMADRGKSAVTVLCSMARADVDRLVGEPVGAKAAADSEDLDDLEHADDAEDAEHAEHAEHADEWEDSDDLDDADDSDEFDDGDDSDGADGSDQSEESEDTDDSQETEDGEPEDELPNAERVSDLMDQPEPVKRGRASDSKASNGFRRDTAPKTLTSANSRKTVVKKSSGPVNATKSGNAVKTNKLSRTKGEVPTKSGRAANKPAPKPASKPEPKPVPKPVPKPAPKPASKPAPKSAPKPSQKPAQSKRGSPAKPNVAKKSSDRSADRRSPKKTR